MLKTAIRDNNPVIFFEHKQLYAVEGEVPATEYTIPFGQADVKRAGSDVTIVAYSFMVTKALAAAEQLAREGIEAEVIDLRTVDPLDEETILASVQKTHRLVIVQEVWRRCSVSSEVAAVVAEKALDYLDEPILRVTARDVPNPFAPVLEEYVLPSVERIVETVRQIAG